MKFEIHCHSTFSDGMNTVREMISHAKSIGLDGIIITDHDTLGGFSLEEKIVAEFNMKTFPGVEVTTEIGHVLVYGLKKIPHYDDLYKFLERVKKNGGASVLAHPYYSSFFYGFPDMEKLIKKFDAIEVINGGVSPEGNLFAIKLAKKYEMNGTGGSDAHFRGNIGKVTSIFKDDIVKSIKEGNLKLTSDDKDIKKLIKKWNE